MIIPRSSGSGLGLRLGLLFGFRFSLGFSLVVGFLLRGLRSLVLEVGRVPAAAFQLKARGAEKFMEGRLAAHRALGELRLAHLLQKLFLVTAGFAAIFIDRHAAIIS